MFCFINLTPQTPPSVIHGWKATDLLVEMVKTKKIFFHPVKRQIFGHGRGRGEERTEWRILGSRISFSEIGNLIPNIARGTTDPEIDSVTLIELGNNMALLTLVANLPTRWRHLH